MSKKLRVFGCGGAGINLVTHYFGKDAEAGMAEMAPALIDTSRSNLMGRKIDEDSTYLVEGLDGSGKIRSENYDSINKTIKQILVQIPLRYERSGVQCLRRLRVSHRSADH